jgi:hypothetical protein
LPRHRARLATTNEQDDKSKGSNFKILQYHNKFWKATPASYLIEFTAIHFSVHPNKSASKRARAATRGDNIHKETNQILNNICGHLTSLPRWEIGTALSIKHGEQIK